MSELQTKFQAIIKKIEERIQDEEDLNFIKEQIAEISMLYLDQLDKLVELNENKLSKLVEHEKSLEAKIKEIEDSVKNMEKEFFIDDNYDFEIVCPYCNYEFVSDFSQSVKEEIECPECHNIIELDWNGGEEEGCSGHCSCCEEDCGHEEENDIENQVEGVEEIIEEDEADAEDEDEDM